MPRLQEPKNLLLFRARRNAGLTQAELGRRVGVSRQTVVAYERDGQIPQPKRAKEIADVFGLRATDLFDFDGLPPDEKEAA
jgi:putative transcriptional regulator